MSADKEKLEAAGRALLEAAMAYRAEYSKTLGDAAVVWLTDTEGRMVVMTRGEYRDRLMQNIDTLRGEAGLGMSFGHVAALNAREGK